MQIYIYIYKCAYVSIYINICTLINLHAYRDIQIYFTDVNVEMNVGIYTYMYTCMYIRTYILIYMYIHIYIYANIHTFICINIYTYT